MHAIAVHAVGVGVFMSTECFLFFVERLRGLDMGFPVRCVVGRLEGTHAVPVPSAGRTKRRHPPPGRMKTVMVFTVLTATTAGLLASSTAYAFVTPSPVFEATASRRQCSALTTAAAAAAATSSPTLGKCCGRPIARSASLRMMVSPSTGSTPGERGGFACQVGVGAATWPAPIMYEYSIPVAFQYPSS